MMRAFLLLLGLIVVGLFAPGAVRAAEEPIRPGDKIGEMEVARGRAEARGLVVYCPEAGDCLIPQVDRLGIGNGWDAKDQAILEENWDAISWELYIDNRPVDLHAFGFVDSDRLRTNIPGYPGTTVTRSRFWDVVLGNPTPGFHPVRAVLRLNRDLDDGFLMFRATTFTVDFDFTVEGAEPAAAAPQADLPRTGGAADPATLATLFALLLLAGGLTVRRLAQGVLFRRNVVIR